MTRVAVNSQILQWAMQRSGQPVTLHRKFPKLFEWLKGESQPTLRQLERLAQATATPFGYFFLPEPPQDQLSIPYYRTKGDLHSLNPSPDLVATVQTMELRQMWMRDYLINEGHEPLPFVGSVGINEEPVKVAKQIREALGLSGGWAVTQPNWSAALRQLRQRIEEAGVLVVTNGIVGNNTKRKLNVKEFRGFILIDEYAPLIFINGADAKAAQMFTLAHELAHVWLGRSAIFDLWEFQPAEERIEQACNCIAAEFLVPQDDLRQFWPSMAHELGRFQQVAQRFKVSELVAARRALDLELITKSEFSRFYQTYMERERRAAKNLDGGGNFYSTQRYRVGRRFAIAVVRAAKEGKLLYREAYRLTGLYGKTFEQFSELVRIGFFRELNWASLKGKQ